MAMAFPDVLDVTVLPEEFERGDYTQRWGCGLYRALKRTYPDLAFMVNFDDVFAVEPGMSFWGDEVGVYPLAPPVHLALQICHIPNESGQYESLGVRLEREREG